MPGGGGGLLLGGGGGLLPGGGGGLLPGGGGGLFCRTHDHGSELDILMKFARLRLFIHKFLHCNTAASDDHLSSETPVLMESSVRHSLFASLWDGVFRYCRTVVLYCRLCAVVFQNKVKLMIDQRGGLEQ